MSTRLGSERLEVRTTKDEWALIDPALAEQGSDLTELIISNLTVAARCVLADRTEFEFDWGRTSAAVVCWCTQRRPSRGTSLCISCRSSRRHPPTECTCTC